MCNASPQVLNIRCLSDAQRLMVVDDKGKILYATSPLALQLTCTPPAPLLSNSKRCQGCATL
jgi:hypothetical protein